VPGRVAAAVPQRRGAGVPGLRAELDLVPDQVVPVPLLLRLDPRDPAALPLRPADAARVEGAHPAGNHQPGGDRHRQGVAALMGTAIAFYVISAFILGFAIMVITTKNTVHSVLFLVLDFLCVAALY